MKKLYIVLAILIILAIPFSVFATTSNTQTAKTIRSLCGIDTSKLSKQQKDDMLNSWKKVMEAKKDAINDMVDNKIITKEKASEVIDQIDEMIKYHEENGFDNSLCNTGCSGNNNCKNDNYNSGCSMMVPK